MKQLLTAITALLILLPGKARAFTAFQVQVTGKGRPILLIPGYSCSGDVWTGTVNHLKNRYECHVLTLAGFAGVAPIDTPVLQTVRDQLIAYVRAKQLQQPVLVGHSLGSFLSLWAAAKAPELFGGLICVDGMPFYSALADSTADAALLKLDPRFNREAMIRQWELIPDSGFIERTAKGLAWQVGDTARAREIAGWQYRSDRKTLAHTMIELCTTDLRKDIAAIKVPVLVLGSIYFNRENSERLIRQQFRALPAARIRIADSKHFIMYDQPQWFYREIDQFLAR